MIQWWWSVPSRPRLARGSGPVGAVDFRVDGVVGVADGEDPVVGVGEDGGQRLGGALPRPVVEGNFCALCLLQTCIFNMNVSQPSLDINLFMLLNSLTNKII